MSKYAANTEVAPDRSRAEIERTLTRYGASGFYYGWEDNVTIIGFRMADRRFKFKLTMPSPNDKQFRVTENGNPRTSESAIYAAYEQAVRQKWRALALVIKAKLEAVESGISTLEDEFLANVMLSDGSTVGEWVQPQIEQVYLTGQMPSMLLGLPSGEGKGGR